MTPAIDMNDRLASLERRLRRTQLVAVAALLGMGAIMVTGFRQARQPAASVLRARMLVLEDSTGRPRIMIGAPLPSLVEDGHPLPARIGFAMLDSAGMERMGMTLKPSGSIGFGLDAPPGVGDDRNRERINLTVGRDGSAEIRMLDQKTYVRSRLLMDRDNTMSLVLQDFPGEAAVIRRLTATGDSTVRRPPK